MTSLDILTYGFSFITDQGGLGFSTITLLTLDNRRILVDTGPASRRPMLLTAFKSRGLAPEDIDTVILTHLHWDHCQNADLFPNARVLVHPKELDYARNPNKADGQVATYFTDMLAKLRVEPVSDGDTVADGVRVIDTPGHTKGHMGVVAEVEGETVLIAGDALPDGGTVRLDGEEISYLDGPSHIEVTADNEGGSAPSLTYTVRPHREPNIDLVQSEPGGSTESG